MNYLWTAALLASSVFAHVEEAANCGTGRCNPAVIGGGTCGVQYEPNNVVSEQLEFVNFYTSPLFYDGNIIPGRQYGFSPLVPFIYATVVNNTLAATTDNQGVLISNAMYGMPLVNGGVQVKGTFNFEADFISGTVQSPLGFDQDPFYATGVFGMVATTTQGTWQMVFLVTNTKIYAMYRFDTTAGANYFRYIIPVANRTPDEFATYSVTLESNLAVSWRINDVEVLRIFPPNQPIDGRFETGVGSPLILTTNFITPTQVQMVFGATRIDPILRPSDPQNFRFACQRTLFNQCSQSLRNAYGSTCQYAIIQNYLPQPNFGMFMTFDQLSASNYTIVPGCALDGNCKPKPVTCPQVRPERRRKPMNPSPVTTTAFTSITTTTRTATTTASRVPCGCRPAPIPTIAIAGLRYRP